MADYYLMNKILEEERTCEISLEEETSYAEHEADDFISKMESQSEEDAEWQCEMI